MWRTLNRLVVPDFVNPLLSQDVGSDVYSNVN